MTALANQGWPNAIFLMTLSLPPSPDPSETPGTPSGLAPSRPSESARQIVDVHVHLWESLEQLGAEAARRIRQRFVTQPWDQPDVSVQALDQAMEPVRYAIVLGLDCGYVGASIPCQQVARYVARQPEKYLGFAGIDPMASGYLSNLRTAVDLGLVGVTVSPAAGGYHPSDSRAMRLYEHCQEMNLPVVVHPGTHFAGSAKLEYSQPYLYDEVARIFPGLRLVLGGVGLPWAEQAIIMIGKHPTCYADLSDLASRPWQLYNVLLLAYQQGVMDRLLFGSDFPFTTPQTAIHNIYSVNTITHGTHLPTIPREQLRRVVERDALACLGLKPPFQSLDPATGQPTNTQTPTDALTPETPATGSVGSATA